MDPFPPWKVLNMSMTADGYKPNLHHFGTIFRGLKLLWTMLAPDRTPLREWVFLQVSAPGTDVRLWEPQKGNLEEGVDVAPLA